MINKSNFDLSRKARLGEYDSTTRRDCTVDGCSDAAEEYEIDMALRHGGFPWKEAPMTSLCSA